MEKSNLKLLQIGNILSFIGTVIVNALANALPLNGNNTGEISDSYPNLFVPVGLTFSIWGIIYILLTLFCIFQAKSLVTPEEEAPSYIEKISFLFIITNLANMTWIFFWHWEIIPLSLVVMLILLFSLIAIYLRLDIGRVEAPNRVRYFVHNPMSVYLGWITIATIANVTALLVSIGWDGFGISEEIWTIIVLSVAILITCAILWLRGDVAYSLVVIWALFGILIKQINNNVLVAYYSLIAIVIIGLFMGFSAIQRRKKERMILFIPAYRILLFPIQNFLFLDFAFWFSI